MIFLLLFNPNFIWVGEPVALLPSVTVVADGCSKLDNITALTHIREKRGSYPDVLAEISFVSGIDDIAQKCGTLAVVMSKVPEGAPNRDPFTPELM